VSEAVAEGVPLGEAIWGAQVAYVREQEGTLIEGRFVDWLA